jgi:hypothetical protein
MAYHQWVVQHRQVRCVRCGTLREERASLNPSAARKCVKLPVRYYRAPGRAWSVIAPVCNKPERSE